MDARDFVTELLDRAPQKGVWALAPGERSTSRSCARR